MSFTDKVVLITGASSGIGASTAIFLSKQAAKLVLVGRNERHLKKVATYCEKSKGIQPLTIMAELTEDAELEKVIQNTIDHFGRLDVLINNAGIIEMGGIKNSGIEMYDKVMGINMRAVYQLTSLATPHLIESKGCIVNVSCVWSTKPSTMALAYNISKAALDQFTRCVALELAPDGVRVNAVNPGFVKTNLYNNTGLSEDQINLFMQNVATQTPLKKVIDTNEVSALIAFLACDGAKSITGTCFPIDSGKSLQ